MRLNQLVKNFYKVNVIRKLFSVLALFSISFVFITPSVLEADILLFKNGKTLENVKTRVKKESVLVQYLDNKSETFPKTMIKSIRLRPVLLAPPRTDAEKIEYEKEKIRVAEALLDANEWEADPDKKLNFAILNFKAGKGVDKEELDLIVELITTNLVKTKLFNVLDRVTVNKVLNEKGGVGCAEDSTNCKQSANSIAQFINAAKILTGTVNKVGKKYYINGNVIDTTKNNIDFAETSIADSSDKFPETAEYFSKKVAGGVFEFAEQTLVLKGSRVTYPNHLAKSAILPGFGQWKKNEKTKARFIFISSITAFGFLFKANKDYTQNKNSYDDARLIGNLSLVSSTSGIGLYSQIKSQEALSDIKENIQQIQIGSLLFLGIYIYNLADAYYTKDKSIETNPKKTGFYFNFETRTATASNAPFPEKVYSVQYSWSF